MRWEVVALALLTLSAGCLGAMEGQEEANAPVSGESANQAAETERIEKTIVFTADVEGPQVAENRVGIEWETSLGPGLVSMQLALGWTEQANGFGLEVERPEGSTHTVQAPEDPAATSVEGQVPEPVSGAYVFHLTTREGPVVEDEVRLEADVVFEVPVDAETTLAEGEGATRGPVQVEEVEDGYRATVTYTANGSTGEQASVDVAMVNGAVHVGSGTHGDRADGEQALAEVTAWAKADAREEARERVLAIRVHLSVESGAVQAEARAEDWDDRGASADVALPERTRAEASLHTTNGPVSVTRLPVDGLVADTTNGPIEGTLTGAGEMVFDTTNGPVDVDVTPTASATIEADTTNGGIQLALNEDEDTGYEIEASTTNGAISEDMEEASLQGNDEEATLRTEGFSERSIQVTGAAETTNGNVHFATR